MARDRPAILAAYIGLESKVTAGVVSAEQRALPDDSCAPFIQTDVAVNPGNSGGTGGDQGLSFAIPVDLAMKVKDQTVATGHATHAQLGVTVQGVNPARAERFKLDEPRGALVSSAQPGGPADGAGLKAGDVVLAADGQAFTDSGALPAIAGQAQPGAKMKLEVWRDGRSIDLTAKLADSRDANKGDPAVDKDKASQGRLGLALRPLQPDERQQAGVLDTRSDGPFVLARLQPGHCEVKAMFNGKTMTRAVNLTGTAWPCARRDASRTVHTARHSS